MERLVFLIDSNVFLEALLEQEKSNKAYLFIKEHKPYELFISDFALHSIGIILFKLNEQDLFKTFLANVIYNKIKVLSTNERELEQVTQCAKEFSLDFDDAYQYTITKQYNLKLVSFDKDFDKTDLKRIEP